MSFPDYYALLGVAQNANSDAIRQAYKRESLKSHPDRVPNATPQQRQEATEKFQVFDFFVRLLSIHM
jgi:curved DNA-binding protein CbpA